MKNSLKTNLVLAAVLAGLSFFAYWYEVVQQPKKDLAEENGKKLISIAANAEIESIKLVDKKKGNGFEAACRSNCKYSDSTQRWDLTSPIAAQADASNLSSFVTSLSTATIQDTLDLENSSDEKLKPYGLDEAGRSNLFVELKIKGQAKPYIVYAGIDTAVGEQMYVYLLGPESDKHVDSKKIRLVPNFIRASMQRELTHWRDKRLFKFASNEVKSLRVRNQKGEIDLAKTSDAKAGDQWIFTKNKNPADNETIDTFLTGIVYTNVQQYVSEFKQEAIRKFHIPAHATYSLELGLGAANTLHFEIFDVVEGKSPKLYGYFTGKGAPEFVVQLDHAAVDKLNRAPDFFRMKRMLTAAQRQSLKKVELHMMPRMKDAIIFESATEGSGWKIASGKLDGFEPIHLETAFQKMGSLRISEFLKGSPPKSTTETSRWQLFDNAGKSVRSFTFYVDPSTGEFYVKLENGEIGKLERVEASNFPRDLSALTNFKPVPQNAAAASTQQSHDEHEDHDHE